MRRNLLPALPLVALALAGCFRSQRPPPPTLASVAAQLLESVEAEGGVASAYVVDAATGAPLLVHRAHARLLPASTMKVLSTAAALSALGVDYRFRTPVTLEGTQKGGLFEGEVVATASGDPSLGSWRFPETLTSCEQVAEAMWTRGIREWRGSVRVRGADGWLEGPLGPGWEWDDAAYAYSAPPGTFVFRENVVDLSLARAEGAACGAVPEVSVTPTLATFNAVVHLDTAAERPGLSCVRDRGGAGVQCVWRSSAEECPRAASVRLAVDEPQALFAACVEDALERRGVARLLGPINVESPAAPKVLAPPVSEPLLELVSPPLSELVKATNKESLNLYAERLGMRFALERTGAEGFSALRTALVEELARRGLTPRDVRPVDGSGLSRHNLATARGLVEVLRTSLAEPYSDALLDSLPVAGLDGTLKSRPVPPGTEGRLRAKTGTLSGQKAFVGVAERPGDAEHPRVVFALMLGNLDEQPSVTPTAAFDRFAEALLTLPLR
ncbi:MAG: D-alanyl-D-alanine carboxypeptidase/D-alanyl-D-alanine-endopeptidase [Myxococcaceae bacterium]|nr:D-alanyl-D-alanine carboxypeptidase/D-alanyl-D-alanine-endopeptidase [Myxococcaceae bacterium]MCI0671607.1 D-alanyl-D-alanine carboxypeptidase/D-alanyl-D-alanine-endopeptidase [Myxococcaceae bacterium]